MLCGCRAGAQFITASQVETWVTDEMPSSDFNLNSAYVFLINGDALGSTFKGEKLSRSQQREVGIRRGDYPQYMYLAVKIPDPYEEGNEFTVPLMIHDVRDRSAISRVEGYGGRLLENIPDEVLKEGDIIAKVKFEAIRANNQGEFWKKTAEISIELGKTATSLLTAPLTGNFLSLTQQIVPQVTQGLTSLEQSEDPQKMTSEFYIRLLRQELSTLYRERVVSATLYRIHWNVDDPPNSRYFQGAKIQRVDDLKSEINHRTTPYILVAHTKSEYNTDHSELVYNQSYIEKKLKDYRRIRNASKKDIEREFLETLKQAIELKHQIENFEKSLDTKFNDWLAYSRIIDLYYDLNTHRLEQLRGLSDADSWVRDKYARLYNNIKTDIDLWFQSELLMRARNIAEYLVQANPDRPYNYNSSSDLYQDIEMLHFYRDMVKKTEIQGKLPKEIEALGTYSLTNSILRSLEAQLYEREFRLGNSWSPSEQKEWLVNRTTNVYPLCQLCARKVREKITEIDNLTHEQNIRKYRQISRAYYDRLGCYEQVYTKLDSVVRANADSLTISIFMLEALKEDKESFEKLASDYVDIMGREVTKLSPAEVSDLLSRYFLNRQKMAAILNRLRGSVLDAEDTDCLENAPPGGGR